MKKNKASIVFAILSVFLFLGCVKELPSPVDGMIFRQYSATISGGTKTEDKGSGKVDWTKGDIIQYWSSDNGRIGTHTVAASGHTEKIKAEVGIDDDYLVAIYGGGMASDNSASGFILSDAICAEQTGAFEDAHISVAKTEKITSGTLQFRNVTSLIKFSINKTNVRKVVISANNGEKIHGSGRISVSTKNSSPIASFVDGGGSEISVSVSGPGTFYISTLPVTLSKGFTVSLYGTSNQLIGVISRSASLTIKANTILDLGTLVPITEISIDKKSLVLEEGETESLTAIFYPEDATSKKITWSSSNTGVATVDQSGKVTAVKAGSATITVTTTDGGYTATCSVTVWSPEPATPEMVDLGLSVKWASFNIGATKPEEYGGYYQWAGLEDVTSTSIYLDWSNCPYHTGSDDKTGWTKYIPSYESSYWSGSGSPDNKTVLDPSDDIAHVKLGDKWRMPTHDEWTELKNNCTWTWTTQNGVAGHKVTSKKSGYTSKSIFLPAAGCREDNDLYGVGSVGFYLSSSLTNHPADAYELYFGSVRMGERGTRRCRGRSARPVYGDRVSVAGVSLSKTSLSLEVDAISTLNATVTPSNAAEKSVSWSSSNEGVATVDQSGKVTAVKAGSATITVTTTDGGYTATCSVTVKSAGPDVPEAVDLGLSVKWASFNIGASKPEEYGGYYQWAGMQDVTSTSIHLDLSNCPYHTGSNLKQGWTKYIPSSKSSYWSGTGSPDNKTVLDPEDDIAHVALGGKWRMPTADEFEKLKNNCTWTWTQLNGVNGYKVTSNISGYTDKYIFLPAAGYRNSGSLNGVGSYGNYWSSSLYTDGPSGAYELDFDSDAVGTYGRSRYAGLSVRSVYGDRISVTGVSLNTKGLSLNIGETSTLSATVTPSNVAEKSVSWSSNNTGVATVDQSGTVTALKAGSATITVTTTDGGYTATCSVTVKETEPYFVIDGQSNYSVDAGGGEFQFIVKSNVEWILNDYHDSSYPWQKTTISKNGNEATVKVIIEANTEYSSRESYIKFTVPSIQDPILDENDQAIGETSDHVEKVYFKQSGLANVAWETVLPSGTKRENQLSIAKGSSTYLLCDGNSFYSFNQKTGAVTTATIPSIGEEIVEITNDDAGNLLLATSTEFGKTFDIYAIPAGTSIDANTNPSLIIHSNSDINGVGPGHITARGNVFEEGIITALVTCWDSAFGAYWEIEKGKATAQPRYVTINIQNLWSPLSAAFSPLGISASSGFIYNGYDGMYNYVYIDKNGSSKKIGSRGDWDAGVNCIVPSFWGNEPIVVANVMSYFPEQYPSYIEIYKLNSMDPVASIQIKTSNGSNNTGRSSCIMLENENGNLIIYCADGSQNVLSKITIPSKYHL